MDAVFEANAWVLKHEKDLEEYAGKWIAISASGIVASANSIKVLLKNKAVKVKDMIVTKVPTKEEAEAVWSL